jgi:hypothetical protein
LSDASIRTQVSAKLAADLAIAAFQHGITDLDALVATVGELLPKVDLVLADAIAASEAVVAAQTAFGPGTVVQSPAAAPAPAPAVPANVVAFPQQAAAAPIAGGPAPVSPFPASVPGPAAIPGAAPAGGADPQVEQAWQQFFADIASGQWGANWDDNRANKRAANSPDFKHKSWKLPGDKYTVSLWIGGKKNPAWVAQQLAAHNIA